MKDEVMLSVTKVLDDETGIWAGDLCEYSIHCESLESFLRTYGQKGAVEICQILDHLKDVVREDYLPRIEETDKTNKVHHFTPEEMLNQDCKEAK